MIHKTWYLIQERAPNKNEWFTLDAPTPVCNAGALEQTLEFYHGTIGDSDYDYRIVARTETVIISTEAVDEAVKHPH